MAITSESTKAQVIAQYDNNLDWDGDPAKAALALAAIRWLLVHRPVSITAEGRTVNYSALETEKTNLEAFIARRGASVNRCSFTRGRMLIR